MVDIVRMCIEHNQLMRWFIGRTDQVVGQYDVSSMNATSKGILWSATLFSDVGHVRNLRAQFGLHCNPARHISISTAPEASSCQ